MRKSVTTSVAGILLTLAAWGATPSTFLDTNRQLLYGVSYYYEYMPSDRLAEDVRMMKQIGLNVVRMGESTWGYFEPQDGEFNTDYLLRCLDTFHKAGIHVIIGTPTYSIPTWLAKTHPEIFGENFHGKFRYGTRQNMDITHPTYLYYAERVIRKIVEVTANHPAVIGYQLDNETKQYDNWGEHVQGLFLQHLKKRFGNPEAMNAAFGLHQWSNSVHAWEDMPSTIAAVNQSLLCEFEKFQRSLATGFLAWQAGIVRSLKRPDQFIIQNFDADWKDLSYGINSKVDHFEASAPLDICGIDIYHHVQERLDGMMIAMLGDLSRSNKGDNYFVMEASGQNMFYELAYPKQLRLQAFSHIASGANMIAYWPWHSIHNGIEMYCKGLLAHDLEPNATTDEATQIASEMRRLSPSLYNLKKENRVAIYFSNEALTAMNYYGITPETDYNTLLLKFYEQLYKLNIECDFADHTKQNLGQYRLLVVPALYSASQEETERLNEFVANGGHVIYTFRSGFTDENVKVHASRQPAPFRRQVGASYQQFSSIDRIPLKSTKLQLPASELAFDSWMELMIPEGAEVWATYDSPYWGAYAAITHNRVGRGSVTYIAGNPTPALVREVLLQVCAEAGISRPPVDAEFPVIVRSGTNERGRKVHFLFNYSGELASCVYRFPEGKDLLTGKSVATGDEVSIPAWDMYIVEE